MHEIQIAASVKKPHVVVETERGDDKLIDCVVSVSAHDLFASARYFR